MNTSGMWRESVLLCLLAILAGSSLANSLYDKDQLEKDDIIDFVNNANTTWLATRNFHPSLKSKYSKILLGLRIDPFGIRLPELKNHEDEIDIPETFDARDKWRDCIGLRTVRDQGDCGSCWAVASASVFTDRLCIASSAKFNGQLSAEDLLSCGPGSGCDGGSNTEAFTYFETHGIVTGGDYRSSQGCQPYSIPKCDHHVTGKYEPCSPDLLPTPECHKSCTNKNYTSETFKKDLHFIKSKTSFSISEDVQKIQMEIYQNGPLVASLVVYEDFYSYKTGVYQHTKGKFQGMHAVKVLGWGSEDGTDYWLVANSWNEDWGDEGFFKIRRGQNECGIEIEMVGGMPDV